MEPNIFVYEQTVAENASRKRLEDMELMHDPSETKEKRNRHYFEQIKKRREAIIELAREGSMKEMHKEQEISMVPSITLDKPEGEDLRVPEKQRYAAKMLLYDYMVQVPADLSTKWLVYAIPEGKKCLVCASEKKTVIRDKSGLLLETFNSLLPNGNPSSSDAGKTIIQGIYSKRDKIVYLTEIMMWNGEDFFDKPAETRLLMLIAKARDYPSALSSENEMVFRMPQIYPCSKDNLARVYFGLFQHAQDPSFAQELDKLALYINAHSLVSFLRLEHSDLKSVEVQKKVCAAFGTDNHDSPYLKDGIAFIFREGGFSLGFSTYALRWADSLCSPYYHGLISTPMVAYLFLSLDMQLQTHDGYIIDKTDPSIESLKPNKKYAFTYTSIVLRDPFAKLENLKYHHDCAKSVWSSMSQLVFKLLARKDLLQYKTLYDQIG